jgi:uncharacterized Zn finger protein
MSETCRTLGEYALTCKRCSTEQQLRVVKFDTGQKVATCPECGNKGRVYGVEASDE